MPSGHEHSTRLAIIGAVAAFIVLNVAYYFLSNNYFDAHREYTPDRMLNVRETFAVTSGVLIFVNFLVGIHRRIGAHVLATVLGLSNVIAGFASLAYGMPGVLVVSQLLAGGVMPVLAWFSYFRRSRAAWAFLVAMCGVFTVNGVFGAPKIGHALSINLWTMLIYPGLFAIAAVALAQLREDYATAEPAAA